MKINIKSIAFVLIAAMLSVSSCKKNKYTFGELKTPTDVKLTTVVTGVNEANPNGNGKGEVTITVASTNGFTYKVDFGDGKTKVVAPGTFTYKYTNPGTFDYIVTVSAIGTGGTTSVTSNKITVFVAFEIPVFIVEALTGGAGKSKIWVTDRLTPGHVGVGPPDTYFPGYYEATPNQRAECLYDDEITFAADANNNITMTIDNKGQSFFTAAATAFYGTTGGDDCYSIDIAAPRKLSFMDATSASTPDVSTRVQFSVPGNGLINFGTGGTEYEILSITENTIHLRNIGQDGLAWYQKLKVKP
ncbi:MAG: PKD domain-containing protein [Mucilaginibacter sp.]